ncbi:MAG: alpha/beta fold hydrolase [Porcipelethomonas sp.]
MAYQKLQTTELYYEQYGTGEPIILIHGSLSSGNETFKKQIPFLKSSYRCICPDLRCHGKSKSLNPDWNTKLLSEDIIEFMNALNIPKAHLIGHSMGGDVAMYCAVNYPDRISSITMLSDGAMVNENINSYLEKLHPDKIDALKFAKFITKMQTSYGDNWKDLIIQTIWNCSIYPDFSDEELHSITAPVFLIRGGLDEMILDSEVTRLKTFLPHFQYLLIENGNHFLHSQKEIFEIVNQKIYTFLTNNPINHVL